MDNLSKRAMLVSLKISSWSARCVDKKVTDSVLCDNQAREDAGSFSKRLLEKDTLKNIAAILNDVRKIYREKTLAWKDGETRLLPVKFVTEFKDKMRTAEVDLDREVGIFTDSYDEYKENAKQMLNGMYNADDYPPVEKIASKFTITHKFSNISDPSDFRCEVSEEIKDSIKDSMKKDLEEQYKFSMKKLHERIFSVVKHFNERLSEESPIFHKSLINNIEELVSILPDLNFMDDDIITALTIQIQNELCRFTPDELRENKDLRLEAAKASADILATMEACYA